MKIEDDDILGRHKTKTTYIANAKGPRIVVDEKLKNNQSSFGVCMSSAGVDVLNEMVDNGQLDSADPRTISKNGEKLLTKENFIENWEPIPAHILFANHRNFNKKRWDALNPRVYKGVDNWEDYRYASTAMAAAIGFMEYNDAAEIDKSGATKEEAAAATLMVQHNMPTFFISQEMFTAAWNTDPPAKVDWQNMKLPHEAAIFILPKGALTGSIGGGVPYISYARFKEGEIYSLLDSNVDIRFTRDEFFIDSMDKTYIIDYHRILTSPYIPALEREYKSQLGNNNSLITVYEEEVHQVPVTDDDLDFNTKLCNALFNLIMMMEAKPELKTAGRRLGTHKKTRLELWSPNILGKSYRIKRDSRDIGEHGTHSSPRWHWRRGHWRIQGFGQETCVCGHGRSSHRDGTCTHNKCLGICIRAKYKRERYENIWIEPMLVNFKEDINL